jgi:leucyl-tRNA synthetase
VESRDGQTYVRATGEKVSVTIEKMAKTALNGINPEDVADEHGADVLRLYELFMGDFELPKPWDPRAIEGMSRFLRRVWRLVEERAKTPEGDPHLKVRHKTIKKVTSDLDHLKFNTAIAALMEYVNELTPVGATSEDLRTLIKLVSPFMPHLGDEAWEQIRTDPDPPFLIQAAWPTYDDALTIDAVVTLAVQVNGKLRGSLDVARDAAEADVRAAALALPNVAKHLEGKTVRKVIVVAGKIVNVVVS